MWLTSSRTKCLSADNCITLVKQQRQLLSHCDNLRSVWAFSRKSHEKKSKLHSLHRQGRRQPSDLHPQDSTCEETCPAPSSIREFGVTRKTLILAPASPLPAFHPSGSSLRYSCCIGGGNLRSLISICSTVWCHTRLTSPPYIPFRHFSQGPGKPGEYKQISSSQPSDGSHAIITTPISKILIANRGEIACRVIRTAKRLGIGTVAVYSDADRGARHVKEADQAVRIGPAPSDQSYLKGDVILEVASKTGAQAIHPGYGFLSENANFAELCAKHGVEFMGPPASAIQSMGDKSASKALMTAAGVPVVPGYHGDNQDPEFLRETANEIGYPVLIKATQGGGGKGMRIVEKAEEFLDSLASAKREAMASFGNDRVLVERYLSRPRHIEVQIFGDKHGDVVYLFERDCSVQRRHQKIIEEAPAPLVSHEFRQRIGEAAVNAAKAVGYVSAGTVEFIVDTTSGEFFFMEMNTRLQVEHPVTEMITGQDLVEWQIRVANGEALPLTQRQLSIRGHSFEARVYAENVPRGFLPATGTLKRCRPPPVSSTVRVETGVGEGDIVSVFYDPMIAKLVVWGADRAAALGKLRQCLGEYQIAGVPTNLPFLQALASHPAFVAGEVDTHFIPRHRDSLLPPPPVSPSPPAEPRPGAEATPTSAGSFGGGSASAAAAVAAAGICLQDRWQAQKQARESSCGVGSIWATGSGFRLNHLYTRRIALAVVHEGEGEPNPSLPVAVSYLREGGFRVEVPGSIPVTVSGEVEGEDGTTINIQVGETATSSSLMRYIQGAREHVHLWLNGTHHHFAISIPQHMLDDAEHQSANHGAPHQHHGLAKGAVVTPMAGRVVKVVARPGDMVEKGNPVLVLEAMKMEHTVRAPQTGILADLRVETGQQVQDGSVLFVIQALDITKNEK